MIWSVESAHACNNAVWFITEELIHLPLEKSRMSRVLLLLQDNASQAWAPKYDSNFSLACVWQVLCVRRMCEAGVVYYSPVEMTQMTGKSVLTEKHSQCRMQKPFRTGTAHKPSTKPKASCQFKSCFFLPCIYDFLLIYFDSVQVDYIV